MKKLFSIIVISAAFLVTTASRADDNKIDGFTVSGSVALTNNYQFYGFSQSDKGWAVQGGLTVSHDSGFYLGTWASVIDFGPFGRGNVPVIPPGGFQPASIELDVSGGYSGALKNGLNYDFGAVRYGYPDQNQGNNLEYWEGYANFSYSFASTYSPSLSFGINVSPDWFGGAGTSYYPHGGLTLSLPQGFGAYVNVGYLDVSKIKYSYTHYKVGVTKDFAGLTFDLGYADAQKECDGGNGLCKGFIFSVSKSF